MYIDLPHWTDSYCIKPYDWLYRIREEVPKNPFLQTNIGMQRRAEFEVVKQIIKDFKFGLFLELGSGEGYLLKEIRDLDKSISIVGFEVTKQNNIDSIDLRCNKNIFESCDEIKDLVKSSDLPVFNYNDNGHKIKELDIVSSVMRPGDVIGCHDFGTEVPKKSIKFLEDRGFIILEQYEKWINENLCLQRFWKKV